MGTAEQGGNLPQRALLIGGPKHGEFMNLPEGDTEYEFTSMETLMPPDPNKHSWESFPKHATHIYKFDSLLSDRARSFARRSVKPFNIFTHEVLWGSPHHGGFNLAFISEAQKAIEEAGVATKKALETQTMITNNNRELEQERDRVQHLNDRLLAEKEQLELRLQVVRQELEVGLHAIGHTIEYTGCEYQPQKVGV